MLSSPIRSIEYRNRSESLRFAEVRWSGWFDRDTRCSDPHSRLCIHRFFCVVKMSRDKGHCLGLDWLPIPDGMAPLPIGRSSLCTIESVWVRFVFKCQNVKFRHDSLLSRSTIQAKNDEVRTEQVPEFSPNWRIRPPWLRCSGTLALV